MSLLLTYNIANNLFNPSLQPAMTTIWPTLQQFDTSTLPTYLFSIKTTLNLGTLQSSLHAGVPISLLCQRLDTFKNKKKILSVKLFFILFIIDATL